MQDVLQPAEPAVSDKPKRRWFQFSLRALLIGITVGSVALGWYMYRWRRQQAEQRKATAAVKELGGSASHSYSSESYVSRMLEGHDAENDFTLMDKHLRDGDLRIFASAEMTKGLTLFRNEITDEGLVHLKDLHHLRFLDLRHNKEITDEGLKHLENLHEMELLVLIGTKVTPAGVAELQQKMPKAKIGF
jgi:hypothetical protein